MAALRTDFPGWRPWRSDAGRWWAVRLAPGTGATPDGWAMTVDADSAAKLRTVLGEQAALAIEPAADR
jgi:hypothetical protein